MVGMGRGISNDQDQLPFHVKDKAEVSEAAACAGEWDGSSKIKSTALQKICWRAFWMDCCCSWISRAVLKFSSTSAVTVD